VVLGQGVRGPERLLLEPFAGQQQPLLERLTLRHSEAGQKLAAVERRGASQVVGLGTCAQPDEGRHIDLGGRVTPLHRLPGGHYRLAASQCLTQADQRLGEIAQRPIGGQVRPEETGHGLPSVRSVRLNRQVGQHGPDLVPAEANNGRATVVYLQRPQELDRAFRRAIVAGIQRREHHTPLSSEPP